MAPQSAVDFCDAAGILWRAVSREENQKCKFS